VHPVLARLGGDEVAGQIQITVLGQTALDAPGDELGRLLEPALAGPAGGLDPGDRSRPRPAAICRASEVVGSWRQSEKTMATECSTAARYASVSRAVSQLRYERWSRFSPGKFCRSCADPLVTYFARAVRLVRSELVRPPELYGGSVMTAWMLSSGRVLSTVRASPRCSV